LKKELTEHLRRTRVMRRSLHHTQKTEDHGRIVDAVSISERPATAEDRAVPGHWEGDLLCGSHNSQIITLVERQTRYVMLVKVEHKDTETVVNALIQHAMKLPQELYKSLTWDRGSELADHKRFKLATDIDGSDRADVERKKGAEFEGDHNREKLAPANRRHSYQVYLLLSMPLQARLNVHLKVLSEPKRASVDRMLNRAIEVYAANGVALYELSRETFDREDGELDRFKMPFVGTDPDGDPTADVTELHTALRQPRDFGVTPAPSELVIAFVESTIPAQRGSSLHPPEQPGIIISAAHATEWTLAFEIARVLGLILSSKRGDLTYPSTANITTDQVELLSGDNMQVLLSSPLIQVPSWRIA
jgi:hypothetical protein